MDENVHKMMMELQKEGGVFQLYSDEEINLLAPYFNVLSYPSGSIASKVGEPLDLMGVIVKGVAILEEATEIDGKWIVHSKMTTGSILAHPSLFGLKPPPIRVVVKEDATFLAINGSSFERLLTDHPAIGIKFLKELIRVLFIRFRSLALRFAAVF